MWAVVNRVAGNALRSWELGWKLHVGMVFGRTEDSEAIALLERGERRVSEAMVVAETKLVENEVASFDLHVPPDLYIEEMRFISANQCFAGDSQRKSGLKWSNIQEIKLVAYFRRLQVP